MSMDIPLPTPSSSKRGVSSVAVFAGGEGLAPAAECPLVGTAAFADPALP